VLRAAIVGCGKIADSHAAQIGRISGCKIVGVCDREPLMARQLYERFPIEQHFSDLGELLREAKPDVVHVTTPPESHFEIAKFCLERGSHVYVEKPFTVNEQEAQELLALAKSRNLKITAGHDDQFRHAARRLRTLVQSGYLGDGPVHMESHYCYQLGSSAYAGALLGDKQHWVRRLPGKLLHNIISHGIARIAEYLASDSPQVMAYGFVSPFLRSKGESDIIDELRVIISEGAGNTAYFTFSSQMRPSLHRFSIYGAKNGLVLDQDQETLLKLPGAKLKSYAEPFITPLIFAEQYVGNVVTNVRKFMANDFHMKSGMKFLIESFYRSVREQAPVPIPYREILLTARIMDAIFHQLAGKESQLQPPDQVSVPAVVQN
jgi:predicted dehydrogenase